jgi:hypothetical protein
MRYSASEKLEIIHTVERHHLSARQTLDKTVYHAPPSIVGTIVIWKMVLMAWKTNHQA